MLIRPAGGLVEYEDSYEGKRVEALAETKCRHLNSSRRLFTQSLCIMAAANSGRSSGGGGVAISFAVCCCSRYQNVILVYAGLAVGCGDLRSKSGPMLCLVNT